MNKLKRSVRDKGQRLILRRTFDSEDDAFLWIFAYEDDHHLENTCPEGWRLLRMGLFAKPEKGAKVELELQWVSQEWWHARRLRTGRSKARDFIYGTGIEQI